MLLKFLLALRQVNMELETGPAEDYCPGCCMSVHASLGRAQLWEGVSPTRFSHPDTHLC